MGNVTMSMFMLYGFVFVVIIWTLSYALSRYRRCPSDKILVIYGNIGKDASGSSRSAITIHGGGAIVWPILQDYMYMDLTPITIDIPLKSALSKQNIRINVPSTFTVGISTEGDIMSNAAERLLGLAHDQIKTLAQDIIFGQLRVVIATMDIEEINADRDKFLTNIMSNVDSELKKIGLKLINVNITDITDESGYIEALGKEAASQAINEARVVVAQKNRDGAVGEAEATRDQRIRVAEANASAVEGENNSLVKVADSDATRRDRIARAERLASAAEKVQSAQSLEEAYAAEQKAETARAEKNRATRTADEIIPAEIQKSKIEIAAEAEAEKRRREAKGDADAIFFKMAAQAKGNLEILSKQAEGLQQLVNATGDDASKAAMLMIVDKLPELVKTQVEAIKGIKIDKVTVWDSGATGPQGTTSTSNFVSGMMKSIPPLGDLFKMAGMDLPNYLGKDIPEDMGTAQSQRIPLNKQASPDSSEDLSMDDRRALSQMMQKQQKRQHPGMHPKE